MNKICLLTLLLFPWASINKADINKFLTEYKGKDLAVLAIDIQIEGGEPGPPGCECVHQHQKEAIELAHQHRIPIYCILFGVNQYIGEKFALPCSDLIFPESIQNSWNFHEYIKTDLSAFHDFTLVKKLKNAEIKKLLLMGAYTNLCVKHTAFDALTHLFHIYLNPDLVTKTPNSRMACCHDDDQKAFDEMVNQCIKKFTDFRISVICSPSRNDTISARKPDDDDPDDSTLSAGMGACGISY